MIGRRIRVTGRVQGVFFRQWTREQAEVLGLSGWVRNCANGSVEAEVTGEQDAVERLIELLHGGPPAAKVDKVEVGEAAPDNSGRFEVRR